MDAQRASAMGMLQKRENEMYSDIEEVRKNLNMALLELGQLVEHQPANTTNSTLEHQTANKIKNFTTEATKKVNASGNNSTKVSPKDENAKKVVAVVGKKAKVRAVVQAQQTILENLFKHLKSNIVNLNKEESSSKTEAAKQIKRLEARLKKDETELARKDLSKFEHEELVNRTRTDKFELQYWNRDRSLGHQMWHTNLKMEHSLMNRVHTVISACKEAVAKGGVDPKLLKKLQGQALPKAFIEMQSTIKHKSQQYYAHVLTARWMEVQSEASESE